MLPLFRWHLCIDCIYFLLQIILRKQIASKRPITEAPTPHIDYAPTFHTHVDQECYARLFRRRFGESREIDWDLLREVGLEAEVKQLLSVRAWWQLF